MKGDRAAIETSIKQLTGHILNIRYEIKIKEEELKDLNFQLEAYKRAQKWRKEIL